MHSLVNPEDALKSRTFSYDELSKALTDASLAPIEQWLEIDLNSDGIEEVLLGQYCGNGGCPFRVFTKLEDSSYSYIGELGFKGIELLQKETNGFSDILSYWNGGAGHAILTRYEFDGQYYQEVSRYSGSQELAELLKYERLEDLTNGSR